jgi:phospholipase/carboxylesterase
VHDAPEAEQSRRELVAWLVALRQAHPGAPVFLLGFSQGAMLTIATLLTEPQLLDGAVLCSGRTLPELVGRTPPVPQRPPVLLFHGRSDARLPFTDALLTERTLTAAGFTPELHPFDGGHEIPPEVVATTAQWLHAHLP